MVYNNLLDYKPYIVKIAKPPHCGKWEKIVHFNSFRKAVRYAKKCEKAGYRVIDIICRNY